LGYPALIAAVGFAAFLARRRRTSDPPYGRAAACAVAAWVAHNAIDIDMYFPSVGTMGIVAAALWLRGPGAVEPGPPRRSALVAAAAFGLPILAFSALALLSTELQHRAQAEYSERKPLVALATLDLAKRLMPLNSSLFYDAGQIALDVSQRSRDPKDLAAATRDFERAIALSPQKVGPHKGRGLCLASANRLDEALDEIGAARALYPRDRESAAIAKLIRDRVLSGPPISR
jgi:tetratricopeptide (TPR) repeat protein